MCTLASWSDTYHGDSGGPLMVQQPLKSDESRWISVGIAVWGEREKWEDTNKPSMFLAARSKILCLPSFLHCLVRLGWFTRVSHYCDWIEKTSRGEVKCLED